ncbi:RES family NAD+ phosphorylase [Rhizobium leguminosarum]
MNELVSGIGGLYVGGRWHAKGSRVTYFASSRALGVLEYLVHLDIHPDETTSPLVAAQLEIPERFLGPHYTREITVSELFTLDPHWRMPESRTCLNIGITWYTDAEHLFLKVPSAVVPEDFNVVLNSSHPAMNELFANAFFSTTSISIDQRISAVLDARKIAKRRGPLGQAEIKFRPVY